MTNKYDIYYKNNKFQQIRGFCNTIVFDGISNAAKHMGISQSAVSHQIGSLEEDLKLKLFKRVGNKMVLTEDGERFYDHVNPTLKKMDNIYEEFLSKKTKEDEKHIRIGATHSSLYWAIPKWVSAMKEINEEAKFTLINQQEDQIINSLINNEIDLGVLMTDFIPKHLNILFTRKYKINVIFSKNHRFSKLEKITLDDIQKEQFLNINNFKNLSSDKFNFINFNGELIRRYVSENIGVTFFTNAVSENDNLKDNLISREIENVNEEITFSVVTGRNFLRKILEDFMVLVKKIEEEKSS